MKIGRNDPCSCGSGLKFKKCCALKGELALLDRVQQRLQDKLQRPHQHDEATRLKMIQAMRDNDADPAYIHAFEQTGVLVFQETMHLIPEEDLLRWQAAYDSFRGA